MGGSTLSKCVGCNECQYIDTSCTWRSLDLEMERVEAMEIRCKDNDRCKTFLLFFHLVLHIVLFVLFWRFFGDPSVEKYLAQETIVISSHEKTNGIQAPAITIVPFQKKNANIGWKSVERGRENSYWKTFSMLNHCHEINFTSMEVCLENDTIEKYEFLNSARFGYDEENSTSLLNDSSWSADVTATFFGKSYTLNISMTLAPTYDDFLIFHLDKNFVYQIWLHDENFFIPHVNPLGFPSNFWRFKFERQKNESIPEPGKFHLITLTKQRKLNLDRSPCEEDPSYSFATCTKEKLSEKIGCRLPWDRWSKQDRKVCNSTTEFEQFEQIYAKLNLAESDEIEKIVGCKKPCNYNEFKFVFSNPETLPGQPNAVAFWAASSKTFTEEEVLLYPLTSFIAEFGGALGLFLGFSFMTIWQEIRGWFS